MSGLKKAGDIAAERGITLVVEPLSTARGQTRMALDTAAVAFPAIAEVTIRTSKSVSTCTTYSSWKETSRTISARVWGRD